MSKLIQFLLISSVAVLLVDAHGRFMKPPNRSSIWRVFPEAGAPINYDDNQLYCGGIHQADDPGSNCGPCGDPLSQARPRDNEKGGRYYAGIIVGEYQANQWIDIEVDLTTSHMGYMELRLCTDANNESQECFNQHVLRIEGGEGPQGTRLPAGPTGLMRARAQLPSGVTCDHCVIQWNYRAGNGWGQCPDGSYASGCGPQETFRGCSDVKIR